MTYVISKGITATFASFTFVIEDFTPPTLKAGVVKTTHQGSTATSSVIYDTFDSSGFCDPGAVKFKVQWDAATVPPVGSTGSLVVTLPSPVGKIHTYTGAILEEATGTGGMGQLLTGELTFKISGVPVVTSVGA